MNESISFLVNDDGVPITIVAGPVPRSATRVELIAPDGQTVPTVIKRAGLDRYFVTRIIGQRSVPEITAFNADGNVIERLTHGPLPPPVFPDGSSG